MASSKGDTRSRKFSNSYRAGLAFSATTKRADFSTRVHKSNPPAHATARRVSRGLAAQESPPSLAPYRYTPLNDDLKEIRLLNLQKGKFEEEIRISICTGRLFPENPPIYEALSYVWGSTDHMVDVRVDNNRLAITRNLAEALPYLRYKDKSRILWIDAICVNQQDLNERSRQVRRMADLYRLANRVVVWLGPEKEGSGYGVRLLRQLSIKVTVDWTLRTMEPVSNNTAKHWADGSKKLPYRDDQFHAICALIWCSWFDRLWVWQEIRLANPNAFIMCGFDTISWTSFRVAIFCLVQKVCRKNGCIFEPKRLSELFPGRIHNLGKLTNAGGQPNFQRIMYDTRHCKYTDPRDRVYAVLNLLKPSARTDFIEPDYEKTTMQLYQDVTLRFIDHKQNLSILKTSGLNHNLLGMPTWTTDWTVVETAQPFLNARAGGHGFPRAQYKGAGILRVTGKLSATVLHVDSVYYRDKRKLIANIRRIAPCDILRGSYTGGGSLMTAYCKTLCADSFGDGHFPPRIDLPQFQPSLDFLSAILQLGKNPVPDCSPGTQIELYLDYIQAVCRDRLFVKTGEGYIGLAPKSAQPGDLICIILGCSLPLLLRPTSNAHHQVVGPCYVQGLMEGEVLLGPIPEQYQALFLFNQIASRNYWVYLDHRSGKIQYMDPRLKLSLEEDKNEKTPMIRYPDGSRQARMTAERLEKRGVKLQTFDLI